MLIMIVKLFKILNLNCWVIIISQYHHHVHHHYHHHRRYHHHKQSWNWMYTSNILNGCVIGNRICLTDTSVIWRIFLNTTTSTNYYYVYYYFYIYLYYFYYVFLVYMKTRFPNNSDKVLKLLEVILIIILIVIITLIIVVIIIITSIITIIIVIISFNICTKNFRDVLVILKMKKFWRMIQSLLNNG